MTTVTLKPAAYAALFKASWPDVRLSKKRPGFAAGHTWYAPAKPTHCDWPGVLDAAMYAEQRARHIQAQQLAGVRHNLKRFYRPGDGVRI